MTWRSHDLAFGNRPIERAIVRSFHLVIVAIVPGLSSGCATAGPAAVDGTQATGRGVPWTIRCAEFSGPERMTTAERLGDTLRQTPGIRSSEVFTRDESDGYARLFYGTYYRRAESTDARQIPDEMRADLDLIRQLGDPNTGQRYFGRALPVRMPQPDAGNPAWRLTNATGKYTLQVAVFEPAGDFWEFKQAAAEHCANLRGQGFEAYYHHSPGSSVVTVGSFGPDAVRQHSDGRNYYTVYSPEVTKLQQNELLKYNLLNGRVYKAADYRGQMVPVPSRLVEIPRS